MEFKDRTHAGQILAERLKEIRYVNPRVLGLPRGGVIVAKPVADTLGVPVEVLMSAKIGSPWSDEYAIGAVSENDSIIWQNGQDELKKLVTSKIERAKRKVSEGKQKYRQGKNLSFGNNESVIVIDDGIATGLTVFAAVTFLLECNVNNITVASPVCSANALNDLKSKGVMVQFMEVMEEPTVGHYYKYFYSVPDSWVLSILQP